MKEPSIKKSWPEEVVNTHNPALYNSSTGEAITGERSLIGDQPGLYNSSP